MPTELLDETDYGPGSGPLAGDRVFKNGDPATTAREQSQNPLWHGLRNIVKAFQVSGDLTVTYATDLADGFPYLGKAIARMARRFRSTEIGSVALDAPSVTFTVDPSKFIYVITEAPTYGPYPDGGIYPTPANPTANNGRTILMVNASDYPKLVGHEASGKLAQLQPGESCHLYGQDLGGETVWIPIGRDITQEESVSIRSYDGGASGTMSSAVTMTAIPHGPAKRLLTIYVPATSVTMTTGATGIDIAPATYGNFEEKFLSVKGNLISDSPVTIVFGQIDSVRTLFLCAFLDSKLRLYKLDGSALGIGSVVSIGGFSFTYPRL